MHSIVKHPWVYLLRRPKSSPAETVKQRYRLAIVASALNDNWSQMQSDFPLLIQKTTGVLNGHSSSEKTENKKANYKNQRHLGQHDEQARILIVTCVINMTKP